MQEERKNDPDIPDDIEEAAWIYGRMFNLDPELLEAICYEETGGTYRKDLVDASGLCYGPMQIHIQAQKDRIAAYGLTAEDMFTADGAMLVAASYLAELHEKHKDMAVVLMKYNGASTALKKYRENGKLNVYTSHVFERTKELKTKQKSLIEYMQQANPDITYYVGAESGFIFIGSREEFFSDIEGINNEIIKKREHTIEKMKLSLEGTRARTRRGFSENHWILELEKGIKRNQKALEEAVPYEKRKVLEVYDRISGGRVVKVEGPGVGRYWTENEYRRAHHRL